MIDGEYSPCETWHLTQRRTLTEDYCSVYTRAHHLSHLEADESRLDLLILFV